MIRNASKMVLLGMTLIAASLSAQAANQALRCDVPFTQAVRDAQRVAASNPNWEAMVGDGVSMAPHYGNGSVLVVDRMPFERLRPGMMVVFVDSNGDWVGHWLTRYDESGWHTQGVNNDREDPDAMTPANYRGVIFGVLHSAGTSPEGLRLAGELGMPMVLGKTL